MHGTERQARSLFGPHMCTARPPLNACPSRLRGEQEKGGTATTPCPRYANPFGQ